MKALNLIGILFIVAAMTAFFYFSNQDKPTVVAADYEQYLDKKWLIEDKNECQVQIDFWQSKLEANENNQVYLQKIAGMLAKRFKLSGVVEDIKYSDEIYNELHLRFPNNVSYLHALSTNAITQHNFKAADYYIQKALNIGEKKYISNLLLTDINLERGYFDDAENILAELKGKQHFDFNIRKMKLSDERGNLDDAIKYMEEALQIAIESNNEGLINWSLSNLGDMYGHQGKIDKSYSTFLKALERNPADLHSLKGIAWIAYSHDKNYNEANRILSFLKDIHPIPDYDLMLSDIASDNNDPSEFSYKANFIKEASKSKYGRMYNSYLAELFLEMPTLKSKGFSIAEDEVLQRPHPVSYSLSAWAHYKNGDIEAADSIINQYVVGKTEEPNAIYRTGVIYLAAGKKVKAKEYLSEAKLAAFELGPIIEKQVDDLLIDLTLDATFE